MHSRHFFFLFLFVIAGLAGSDSGAIVAEDTFTIDAQVSASVDDAYDDPAPYWPSYSHTSSSIFVGSPGAAGPSVGGHRFENLNIPELAIITVAHVEFNQSGWGYVIPSTLALEDEFNPPSFSSTNTPLDRWDDRTTAEVSWTWNRLSPGTWHQTPPLVNALQELVDTYGAIDSVVVLERGDDLNPQGQSHTWTSFDSSPLFSAKLHIEYQSGEDLTPAILSNPQPAVPLPAGTTQVVISVNTDEIAICKYDTVANTEYADITKTFDTTGGTFHSTLINGLADGASVSYYARCLDESGNANQTDFEIFVSVDLPDLTPPVISNGLPSGDLPSGTSQTTLTVDSDENATCKYSTQAGTDYSSADMLLFSSTSGTVHSTQVGGLQQDATNSFYIRCEDVFGNANQTDFLITFTVLPDTSPPFIFNGKPTGALPTGTTQVTLSLNTDEAANCRYAALPDQLYASMTLFDTTGSVTHNSLVTGLLDGTVNMYYVKCQDAAGNTNPDDQLINFTVSSPGPTVVDARVSESSDDAYDDPDGWPGFSHTSSSIYAGRPGGGAPIPVYGGWRWTDLNIPNNAIIQFAYAEFVQSGWGYINPTTLAFHDTAEPETFSSINSPADRWADRTTFELLWTWPRQSPGDTVRTPPLTEGIQELVNDHSGVNSIVLLEDGTPTKTGQSHTWQSFDSNPLSGARLYIEYTLGEIPDTSPPSRSNGPPNEEFPSGTTQVTISLDTDENATCKYAPEPGVLFHNMVDVFTTTGGTAHSTLIAGLSSDSQHSRYVRCQDESGNANADDFVISFHILNEQQTNDKIGVPWSLEFTGQPATVSPGATLSPIVVTVLDVFGNLAPSAALPVSVQLANNNEGAVLTGTLTVDSVNGVSTFNDLIVNTGGEFTFVASAPIKLVGTWVGDFQQYGTVSGEGNYAYVAHANGVGGVNVIDVSDPANPTFVSNWGNGSLVPHEGGQVIGGIGTFGSDNNGGASIIDFSDPELPTLRSRITADDAGFDLVHNTHFDGRYLYLMENTGPDVVVFDTIDPDNPVLVNTITSPSGHQVHDVAVVGERLYMFEITGPGNTQIFDLSNGPENAVHIGLFLSGINTHSGQATPDSDYLIVNRETLGPGGDSRIFDVRDPNNVKQLAIIDPIELGFGDFWPHEAAVKDNVLYYAWRPAGFQMFELSDPADPIHLGGYETSTATVGYIGAYEIFPWLGHDRILVTDSENGLFVFDTTPIPTRSQTFTVQ